MLICGRGSPTVVFESGGYPASGNPLEAWKRVQPEVSQFTSTVAYDRAGIGLSPPRANCGMHDRLPANSTPRLEMRARHPPYILVGSSFGGPLIRVFAGMFPADVGGYMVLVKIRRRKNIITGPKFVIRARAMTTGEAF